MGFPVGASGKEPTRQCRRCKRCGFDPWVTKIPWERKWQLTPVWPEEPGSLGHEDPLGKEMATYYSILSWRIPWTEEPATVHRVAKSWTQLKQFSTHMWRLTLDCLARKWEGAQRVEQVVVVSIKNKIIVNDVTKWGVLDFKVCEEQNCTY